MAEILSDATLPANRESLETAALTAFVRESNLIEGITRDPTREEIFAHERLLFLDKLTVPDIEAFVEVVAPGKRLRNRAGMNVRVGQHFSPSGGRNIEIELMSSLARISKRKPYPTPFDAHCRYENLHPFMDGNGRSGRAIWLWMMDGEAPLGFLHHFYYQTLNAQDGRKLSARTGSAASRKITEPPTFPGVVESERVISEKEPGQ